MSILTGGLATPPYNLVTGGLASSGVGAGTGGIGPASSSVPSALLTSGLGFSPYTLVLGGLWGAKVQPDLLASLVAYLTTEPTVASLLTPGYGAAGYGEGGYGGETQVWEDAAASDAYPPFVLIRNYTEALPGNSLDDMTIECSVVIVTNSLDQARAIGAAVKAALDHPNNNPASLGREPFAFEGGIETFLVRDDSRPKRMLGIGRGGDYVYGEQIDYQFHVDPEQ